VFLVVEAGEHMGKHSVGLNPEGDGENGIEKIESIMGLSVATVMERMWSNAARARRRAMTRAEWDQMQAIEEAADRLLRYAM